MTAANPSVPASTEALGDFTSVDRRLLPIVLWAVLIGVVAAFVAVALLGLIGFFTNLFYYGRLSFAFVSPAQNTLGLYAIGIPIAGGLVVGLLARFGSERIRGHGIPEALEAILIHKGRIDPRVTVLKPVATAVSIGSGGPFGAEGPIIMTGGAFGSVLAQFLRVTAAERTTLLVAGASAGMAAVFNAPLAAVLLAVELLLFEWKPRSLIPVGAAVATATVLRWALLGSGPLFPLPLGLGPSGYTLLSALAVGALAGFASLGLTRAVYASEDAFRKLPVHWMWWPALGGLVVGVGGILEPRALGVGYGTINAILLAQIGFTVLLGLVLVKATIWAVALGSGTSGGVLAPLLIIGGAIGALAAPVLPGGTIGLFALVGMGAMIGGTMRSPFTGVVFSLELTHDINALLPLLVAALLADGITVLTMPRSILTEKVARRGVHVAREYSTDPLERVPVSAVARRTIRFVPGETTVGAGLDLVRAAPTETGLVTVGEGGHLEGFVGSGDLRRFVEAGGDPAERLGSLAVPLRLAARSDEPMRVAADRLARIDGMALPVVDGADPTQVMGFLTRESPFEARVLWTEAEGLKERSWAPPFVGSLGWIRSRLYGPR